MTIRGPSPADMLLFAAVVTEGSFTRAAAKHGTTKQSVSERVARLEGQLGVRLLERTTRRVRPTEIGFAYFERCRRIAAEVDEANHEARARQVEPSGTLRISAPYLFGRRFLGPIVAGYMKDLPKVSVEIHLGDRRVNLVEEGFDLAIRAGRLDDSSLTAKRLGDVRTSTVAAPSFLRRTPLRDRKALATAHAIGIRAEEEWFVGGRRVSVRPRLVVNDLEIACGAAIEGLGVAHLPEIVTADHLAAGRLRRVLEGAPELVPVFAVFPSRRFLSAKVRAFVDRLTDERVLATYGASLGLGRGEAQGGRAANERAKAKVKAERSADSAPRG